MQWVWLRWQSLKSHDACYHVSLILKRRQKCIATDTYQVLHSPVNAFPPLLLTLHAISSAATMTDTTMRMTTTATTAPMITSDPLPKGEPTEGGWVDGPTWLLPPTATASGLLLCWGVDESTAIGSWPDEDGKWGNATVLGETLAVVATATDERTAEFDETEVLVTSDTAQCKY